MNAAAPTMAARLAELPAQARQELLAGLGSDRLAQLPYLWPLWARADQMEPSGTWRTWLLLGGRGSGKTRTAAETVRAWIESGRRGRVGVVSPTADSIRRDAVEGPSGLLSVAPPWNRPNYEPSNRRVVWENGAVAHLFSGEEPDRIRGSNLDAAWVDEFCALAAPRACWDMLNMALRIPGLKGDAPQVVVSTTPKPIAELKELMAAPTTVITRSRTFDNAANLDSSTLSYLHDKYAGTTLGRQELDAELILDWPGALWNRAMLDACRVPAMPQFKRIVVAIDPAGSANKNSDETGIIAAGLAADGNGYVLIDQSGKYSPDGWARRAVELYRGLQADRIVCEANFGGNIVEATIRAIDPNVPVKMVFASRGKAVRAEPVVAFYEQRRVHHVGNFPELEDQLCGWDPIESSFSPDRLDALVWCLTDLMVERQPQPARWVQFNLMGR